MNNLDKQYTDLLQDILDNGIKKGDRTGTGTISVFGRQMRHKMSEGFPLLTTKKMYFKGIATELIWFLRGDTNIKYLIDNDCHIWDGDCYKNFEKHCIPDTGKKMSQEEFVNLIKTDDVFAENWGNLGPIYGKQWRDWHNVDFGIDPKNNNNSYHRHFDQIKDLINDLRTNPDSRRLMVNAWNVGEIDRMALPPCHYGFQVYTREFSESERGLLLQPYGLDPLTKEGRDKLWKENNLPTRKISLMWNQRSVDTFLGLPFNIASYGLLLEIIAKIVNMVPDELIGNLGDTHLYSNHIEQAKEQIGSEMTFEEKLQWVMRNTDVELENLAITEEAASNRTPNRTRQPYGLPKIKFSDSFLSLVDKFNGINSSELKKLVGDTPDFGYYNQLSAVIKSFNINDFIIENYKSHPSIKAPLSN